MTDTNTLEVIADFDWLDSPERIGFLQRTAARGDEAVSFEYDFGWLDRFPDLVLSDDLLPYPGRQFLSSERKSRLFGCFQDALPDRWGRVLIKRREELEAAREERAVRSFTDFDLLCALDDCSRLGGLRFRKEGASEYLNAQTALTVPAMTSLRELAAASRHYEESEEKRGAPKEAWLAELLRPGSSLGGARPKACVRDESGRLWVAKFPSVKDELDSGGWERWAQMMAAKAGIRVCESQLMRLSGGQSIYLMRRFDRTREGRRRHFASAMTLLGLDDGAGEATGNGYLDIADFVVANCACVEENLHELYRRAAFSIAIGNTDDHFRNHGFLLTPEGWTLSPVYDINPTLRRRQALLIDSESAEASLERLLAAADGFYLSDKAAKGICEDVQASLSDWKECAESLGLPAREIAMFAGRMMVASPASTPAGCLALCTAPWSKR